MDDVTRAIQAMYEDFPYPTGTPEFRVSADVRLSLSYSALPPPQDRPLRVLDAGCGRGIETLGAAMIQPDVEFLGIDISRTAIDEAKAEAARIGLDNARFELVDLMTLEGLKVPDGGFDLIHSSGVVHHLSDPLNGLKKLKTVLAPHGQIIFMVYGRNGRQPLYRLVEAIDLLIPRTLPVKQRLPAARALAASMRNGPTVVGPWRDAHTISDVEFVDRYLNVNETSYDIDAFFALIEGAGLSHLRWCMPNDWSVASLFAPGAVRDQAMTLDPRSQYKLIDKLFWRHRLENHLVHPNNGPRKPLSPGLLAQETFAKNPECSLEVRARTFWHGQKTESVVVRDAQSQPLVFKNPQASNLVLLLRDQDQEFTGAELLSELAKLGLSKTQASAAITELMEQGYLYRPHVYSGNQAT